MRRRLTVWLLALVVAPAAAEVRVLKADSAVEVLAAINGERARLDRPPMERSVALDRVARQRAAEISGDARLDFEGLGGADLLTLARSLGYEGLVVQELSAVDDRSACEIVEGWNARFGASDLYRRPEARELGIASGFVGDNPLTLVVVGVPASSDPLRKRWPGVAPREYLVDDLFRLVEQRRFGLGLPAFERSGDLDVEAQHLADEILADPERRLGGEASRGGATALYFKGEALLAWDPGAAVVNWLQAHRDVFAGKGRIRAGAGLSSSGRGDRVEAAWVLLLEPGGR